MNRYIIFMICAVSYALFGCSEIEPSLSDLPVPDSHPYSINTEGYSYYRTPAMVITNNSTVLAFAQGRVDSRDDVGNNDIVLRRSTDRGNTWQPMILIKDVGELPVRGPSPIYDSATGRVYLVSSLNFIGTGKLSCFVTYSDDEGLTWAPEKEISADVIPSNVNKWNTGPGHGIIKQHEPNKDRMIVACYYQDQKIKKSQSTVIYSDDKGQTWHRGGSVAKTTSNECTVCELSDGRLLLNMRIDDDALDVTDRYRYQSYSSDGGMTWSECEKTALPEPQCQASILNYGFDSDGNEVLLFSNPANQSNRTHLTVRASVDGGVNWNAGFDCTDVDHGSYSSLARFPDGEIALLYEYGYLNSGGIVFKKFRLDELK